MDEATMAVHVGKCGQELQGPLPEGESTRPRGI